MEEERRAFEKAQKRIQNSQQETILNRKGNSRARLAFEIKPKIV